MPVRYGWIRYGWSTSEDEGWQGGFYTRDAALADGRDTADEGDTIYTACIEYARLSNLLDTDELLDTLEARIADNYGNEDELITGNAAAREDLNTRLRAVLDAWQDEAHDETHVWRDGPTTRPNVDSYFRVIPGTLRPHSPAASDAEIETENEQRDARGEL